MPGARPRLSITAMRSTTLILPALLVGAAAFAAGCGGSNSPTIEAPAQKATPELPSGRIAFRRYLDDAHTQGARVT